PRVRSSVREFKYQLLHGVVCDIHLPRAPTTSVSGWSSSGSGIGRGLGWSAALSRLRTRCIETDHRQRDRGASEGNRLPRAAVLRLQARENGGFRLAPGAIDGWLV